MIEYEPVALLGALPVPSFIQNSIQIPINIFILEIIRKIPNLINIGEIFGAFQLQP